MDCSRVLRAVVKMTEKESMLSLSLEYLGKSRTFKRCKEEKIACTLRRIALAIGKQKLLADGVKKKKDLTVTSIPQVLLFQQPCREVVNKDLRNADAWKTGYELWVDETAYIVACNPPGLAKLELPACVMAGFPVFPIIEFEFANFKQSLLVWHTSLSNTDTNSSCDWQRLAEGPIFVPGNNLIDTFLRLECYPGNDAEQCLEPHIAVTMMPVAAGPGCCPFEVRHVSTEDISHSKQTFRIMSYNILADCYAGTEFAKTRLFPYCPGYAMDIEYRRQLLLKEITGYKADVICLQECDSKQFDRYFRPALTLHNYSSSYCLKAGGAPEGEALFFNEKRFVIQKQERVICKELLFTAENNDLLLELVAINPGFVEEFTRKSAVGQLVILQDRAFALGESMKIVAIINTHLYYKANYPHIRILQIYLMMNAMSRLLREFTIQHDVAEENIGVLLCGDLNSTPDTVLVKFLLSGLVGCHDADVWANVTLGESAPLLSSLQHSYSLTSLSGFPEFTNFVMGFKGTLDYIFGNEKFRTEAVVPINSRSAFESLTALPSIVSPSDHLPLVCDVAWV